MPSKAANKGKGKAAAVMPVKPGPGRGRALGKGTGTGKAASKVAAAAPEVDQEDDNEDEEEEEELLDNEEADEAEGASDDEGSDADDTVDEAGMAKLMELLGDVDPEELGFDDDGSELELEVEGDEAEDGEEASQEEDQEDGEDLDALSGSDAEDDEAAEDEQLDAAEVARAERASRAVAAKKQEGILDRILAKIKLDVPFFETQTLVCPEPLDIPDAANDLQRELQFYKQSLWAAQHAYKLFKRASVPFTRPNDYYAEMLKTDEHMEKIRQKLLDEQAGIKASDNAKRQRELKKFGKQVQVNKLREREKSKRDLDDKVKAFKKKRKNNPGADGNDDFEIDLDDSRPNKRAKAGGDAGGSRSGRGGARGGRGDSRGSARGGARGTGKTRDQRNSKFGQPTTGRRPKENDRESTDMFGGGGRGRGGARGGRGGSRGGLRGGRGGGRGGGASKPRLGKSRRS